MRFDTLQQRFVTSSSPSSYQQKLFDMMTPETSVYYGDLALFHLLLQTRGYPLTKRYSLLNLAMRQKQHAIAESLIDQPDWPVNREQNYASNTPLHYAIRERNRRLAEKLLARGASIESRNTLMETPLHTAFRYFDGELIDRLLDMHVDVSDENLADGRGLTYLHVACCRNKPEVVDMLLQNGINVDCQINLDDDAYGGYTPLHMAVACNQYEVADLLLNCGANIYMQDCKGSTPLHEALLMRDAKMMRLLLEYDQFRANPANMLGLTHFHAACALGEVKIVSSYLRTSTDIAYYTNQWVNTGSLAEFFPGYTPLHFAAESGNAQVCSLLLTLYANTWARNSQGYLPSELARLNRYYDVAQMIEDYRVVHQSLYDNHDFPPFEVQSRAREETAPMTSEVEECSSAAEDEETSYERLKAALDESGSSSSPKIRAA